MTSSASCSAAPTIGMPRASSALADDRHLHLERVGHDLDVGADGRRPRRPGASCSVGMRSTRHCGRQSSSQHATRCVGSIGRDEPRDDVEEPAHRVDGRAVGRPHGVGHAVEGAEVQRRGVEQHEAVGHALILPRRCDAGVAAADVRGSAGSRSLVPWRLLSSADPLISVADSAEVVRDVRHLGRRADVGDLKGARRHPVEDAARCRCGRRSRP